MWCQLHSAAEGLEAIIIKTHSLLLITSLPGQCPARPASSAVVEPIETRHAHVRASEAAKPPPETAFGYSTGPGLTRRTVPRVHGSSTNPTVRSTRIIPEYGVIERMAVRCRDKRWPTWFIEFGRGWSHTDERVDGMISSGSRCSSMFRTYLSVEGTARPRG